MFPTIDDSKWLSNIESTHWLDHIKVCINIDKILCCSNQMFLGFIMLRRWWFDDPCLYWFNAQKGVFWWPLSLSSLRSDDLVSRNFGISKDPKKISKFLFTSLMSKYCWSCTYLSRFYRFIWFHEFNNDSSIK